MNEACRYWHAAYNSAAIAVEMGTVAQLGATASILTMTQAIIATPNLSWKRLQNSPESWTSYQILFSCGVIL